MADGAVRGGGPGRLRRNAPLDRLAGRVHGLLEPGAVLRDERARVVGRAGDSVRLDQVDAFANAGTFGDPYVASGILFDGCYIFGP